MAQQKLPSGPVLHVQTIAQRNALNTVVADGQLCYVADDQKHYKWDGPGTTWNEFGTGGGGGATDHGALTGLSDDDHTQYAAIAQDESIAGQWTFTNAGGLTAVGPTHRLGAAASGTTITTPGTELVLEETGDSIGTSRLRIQSRTGMTGALFESASVDVVDFGFKAITATQGLIRFENRAPYRMTGASEFQIGTTGNGNLSDYPFSVSHGGRVIMTATANGTVPLTVQGNAAQTADLTRWYKAGALEAAPTNLVARVDANGIITQFVHADFSKGGDLSTGTGPFRWYNDTGVALTIVKVRASVGTPSSGTDIIVDVNNNGTTIFSGGTDRPQITAGANTDTTTGMSDTTLADGEYLTVDIDQVGSGTHGSDLTVQVWMKTP